MFLSLGFLQLCNGTRTAREILVDYDPQSHAILDEFTTNLEEIGAIEYKSEPMVRQLPTALVRDSRLQAVHLEPNSLCNMRCLHCYQGERYADEKGLSLRELMILRECLTQMQTECVSFSGGEPLVYKHTFDFARCLEQSHIRVNSIFTNGWSVNAKVVDQILALRSRPTLDLFIVQEYYYLKASV